MSALNKVQEVDLAASTIKDFSANGISEKNYLNRIVEIDPEKSGRSHARKEKLWQVASIALVVGFLIFAAGAAIATSLLFPTYIPLTALITLSLVEPVYQLYAKCKFNADQHEGAAKEEFGVAKEMNTLKAKGIQGSLDALRNIGISTYQIKNFHQLKNMEPVIALAARYEFWRKREQELNLEVTNLLKEKPENPEVVKSNRINAYMLKQLAYFSKAKAAYYYGLTLNPFQKAEIDDIYTVHSPSLEDRYLEKIYDKSERFLVFKDVKKSTIGMGEMDAISIPSLAQKIMSAAPNA